MNPRDRVLTCLRCGTKMRYIGQELFQLGRESASVGVFQIFGARSAVMDVYKCPDCKKLEFFEPDD